TVAIPGGVERRERIEKARRKAPQAAVAKPGVWLLLEKHPQVNSVFGQTFAAHVDYSEVEQIVLKRTADHVFDREIENLLGPGTLERGARLDHLFDQHIAHRQRRYAIPIVARELNLSLGDGEANVMVDKPGEKRGVIFRGAGTSHIGAFWSSILLLVHLWVSG